MSTITYVWETHSFFTPSKFDSCLQPQLTAALAKLLTGEAHSIVIHADARLRLWCHSAVENACPVLGVPSGSFRHESNGTGRYRELVVTTDRRAAVEQHLKLALDDAARRAADEERQSSAVQGVGAGAIRELERPRATKRKPVCDNCGVSGNDVELLHRVFCAGTFCNDCVNADEELFPHKWDSID